MADKPTDVFLLLLWVVCIFVCFSWRCANVKRQKRKTARSENSAIYDRAPCSKVGSLTTLWWLPRNGIHTPLCKVGQANGCR